MRHRHLIHEGYTLSAIDDIIDHGTKTDWVKLRKIALADRSMMERIEGVCLARLKDPEADRQRYGFWRVYAEKHLA